MALKLFDDNISREDTGPIDLSETRYAYLNRSGRPEAERIRSVLEDWFSRYPEDKQDNLQRRFKGGEHESAFFELYLHEILIQQGFECKVHPVIEGNGGSPDFLVRHNGQDCFYLEAIVRKLLENEARHNRFVLELLAELDKIPSKFLFEVTVEGTLTSRPSLKPFKKRLREIENKGSGREFVLCENRPDVLRGKCPKITIAVSPRPEGSRSNRNVTGCFLGAEKVHTVDMIRNAIKKKAGRYGKQKLPFIIAINVNEIVCKQEDVADALFGNRQIVIDRNTGKCWMDRDPHNAALKPPGRNGKNTRVSGLIIVNELFPWTIAQKTPELWHNPWADKPLPSEFWQLWQLPQWILNKERGIYEKKDGKGMPELLGLSPNWPEE